MEYSGTDSVSIAFSQPPLVEITDPISEENSNSAYIYVDIDYTGLPDDEDIAQADKMRVEFSVTEAMSDYSLKLTSGDMSDDKYQIYSLVAGVETGPLDLTASNLAGQEEYVLYIDMTLMKDKNIREFTITARDSSDAEGAATFTLLRRSLFPLD